MNEEQHDHRGSGAVILVLYGDEGNQERHLIFPGQKATLVTEALVHARHEVSVEKVVRACRYQTAYCLAGYHDEPGRFAAYLARFPKNGGIDMVKHIIVDLDKPLPLWFPHTIQVLTQHLAKTYSGWHDWLVTEMEAPLLDTTHIPPPGVRGEWL